MIPKYEDMASINNISAELAYKFAVFYDKIAALEIQNEQLTKERDELVKNSYEFNKTLTELRQCVETLTKERDEARRYSCDLEARITMLEEDRRDTSNNFGTNPCSEIILPDYPLARDPKEIAKRNGWDCYKEETK